MEFSADTAIATTSARVWTAIMDVHTVAECLGGVESLTIIDDDHYEGVLGVKMGPVKLKFAGQVTVTERDGDRHRGTLEATARDRRAGGGFSARLTVDLDDGQDMTRLEVVLATTFLGRIGELGRPLIRKKINGMMDDFLVNLKRTLEETA